MERAGGSSTLSLCDWCDGCDGCDGCGWCGWWEWCTPVIFDANRMNNCISVHKCRGCLSGIYYAC